MVYILSWKFSIHRDTCHIDVIYLHKDYFKGRLKRQLADISKLAILTKKSISGVDNHGKEKKKIKKKFEFRNSYWLLSILLPAYKIS